MNSARRSAIAAVFGLLPVSLIPVQAVLADISIDETHDLDSNGYVTIINPVGELEIEAWNKDQVSISGRISEESKGLQVSRTGSGLRIEVKMPKKHRHRGESKLLVKVPGGASVEAETVSADIYVDGVEGERVVAASVSGDLDIEAGARVADLQSVSGDIEYRGKSSQTQIETVSGEVIIDGVMGEIRVDTVSGDVEVVASGTKWGRFETVSGDLVLDTELSRDVRLSFESMSGDVELVLKGDISTRFEAASFSGTIRSDFGAVEKRRHGPQTSLDTVAGDGDGLVRIDSFSGDIAIRR